MKHRFRPFILLFAVLLLCFPVQVIAAALSEIDYIFATTSYTQLPINKEITWSVELSGADMAGYTVQYNLYRRDYNDTGRDYAYYASGTVTGSSFSLMLGDEGRYILRFDVTDSHGNRADLFGGYYTTIGTYGIPLKKAIADVVVDDIAGDGVAKWLEAALRGEAYCL